uniref:Uncharacterized protein n=1 Tax=Helicotheca tamesis TaxID=374047 RepID=A0A7S2MNS6_9STRA|mmetsp:Transcript_19056/g.26240  ORF Transcript_19056/g.26240 Transcript_19056/m.26240 type:complete len:412 (+) Transcript_19056:91-1326(+)|eukprot:CAMPEP_0185726480 /NCGR_PEP_ID=MMETSP1171-20130828/2453_1 /TAXON_ID=374046 /ORGANISM="Helicotheca tamensis, Strain CCMP826" /LENGTH=411 /DNA_ID=CAMNT_0028394847 /DNA_START=19 /DNA_END=1254 /DNA_ORIENTATION=+
MWLKQHHPKQSILCKKKKSQVYVLLEIAPHKERERRKFNNDALRCAVQHCPKSAIEKQYVFHSWPANHRLRQRIYPIKAAVALGATADVIDLMYRQYPQALDTKDCADILHVALRYNATYDVVKYLVERCPRHLRHLACGKTPLHEACLNDSPSHEILNLFVEQCPDTVSIEDSYTGSRPLHYLCSQPNVPLESIKLLVEHSETTLQDKNRYWKIPLHCACERGAHHEVVRYLTMIYPQGTLENEFSWNIPLHLACENNASIEVIKVLLDHDPESIFKENRNGETPIMLAKNKAAIDSCESPSYAPTSVLTLLKSLESYLDIVRHDHKGAAVTAVDDTALLMPILKSFCNHAWICGVFLILDKYPSMVHQLGFDDTMMPNILERVWKHYKLQTMYGILKNEPYYMVLEGMP